MLDSAAYNYERVMKSGVYKLVEIAGTTRDEVVAGYRNIFLTKEF